MASANDKTVTIAFDPTAINKQSDIISGATPTRAGVMTAAQAVAVAAAATGLPALEARVDSLETSVDSLNAAVPQTTTAIVVDNNAVPVPGSVPTIADGLAANANLIQIKASATPYDFPTGTYYLPKPSGFSGTPLTFEGELSAPLVNGTVQGGDVTTPAQIADGTLAMVPGAYRGKFVQVTLPFVGAVMSCIIDNNATEVFLQSPIGPPAPVGTTWQIVEPAVTINVPDTEEISFRNGDVNFLKLNLVDPVGDAVLSFVGAGAVFNTCTLTGFFGGGGGGVAVLGGAAAFVTPLGGGGAGIYVNNSIIFIHDGAVHAAKIVADNMGSWSDSNCSHHFVDANVRGCDIEAFGNCDLRLNNTNGNIVKTTLDGDLFGAGFLVLLDVNSVAFTSPGAVGEVVMQNSSGVGMLILRGAYARMGNVTGINAVAGFELFRMARLTTQNSTVTGAAPGSDLLFDGSGTFVAYGALPFVDSTTDLSQAAAI